MSSLRRFKSHKIVQALKIESIEKVGRTTEISLDGGSGTPEQIFVNGEGRRVEVDQHFISRSMRTMDEMLGGYYVRYPNDFVAWSPADAFEDGYTEVE